MNKQPEQTNQGTNESRKMLLEDVASRTSTKHYFSDKTGFFYINISRDPMDVEIKSAHELRKLSEAFKENLGISFNLTDRFEMGNYAFTQMSSSDEAYQAQMIYDKSRNSAVMMLYAAPALRDLYGHQELEKEIVSAVLTKTYGSKPTAVLTRD